MVDFHQSGSVAMTKLFILHTDRGAARVSTFHHTHHIAMLVQYLLLNLFLLPLGVFAAKEDARNDKPLDARIADHRVDDRALTRPRDSSQPISVAL